MKRITITLITANKETIESAEPVKKELEALFGGNSNCISFEEYVKIPNCFKMVFEVFLDVATESDFNYNLLTLSSSMARPWMIYFQDHFGTEMIFNRTEGSSYNRETLSSILWAHIQHNG